MIETDWHWQDREVDYDSGVFESSSSLWIETHARLAYTMADLAAEDCADVGQLLENLVGGCRIRFVDMGVARGDAQLSFREGDSFGDAICIDVRFLSGQSRASMTIAGARACGRFVNWQFGGREWPERVLAAVALAIAMPERAFARDLMVMSVLELAEFYAVTPEHVLLRQKMIRGAHDSTERAAAIDFR